MMKKGVPETLEEALNVINALNERTAAYDVQIAELNAKGADLQEIPLLIGELDKAKSELMAKERSLIATESEVQSLTSANEKLRLGLAAMLTNKPGGMDLVLSVLLDSNASAAQVAKNVEIGLLEATLETASRRLAELKASGSA